MMKPRDHFPSFNFRLRFILLLGAAVVFMLSACGKKGPLYLPDQAGTPQKTVQSVDKDTATETSK